AGVQVTENSAEPGGEISIKIRGIASITGSSEPLIVVDGIPMSVNLKAINPNDIESIDISKDAAASAIYGSRASAGVIFVTTKRGKAGKVSVNFDAFSGVQYATKKIPLLNGTEFARLANENLLNGGQVPNPAWSNPANVLNTDWQDAMFVKGAPLQNYNLSISGGSEKFKSYLSLGYQSQNGIVKRSRYERITSRINLDYDLSKRIKIGASVNLGWDSSLNPYTQNEFAGVLLGALRAQPTDPAFTDQVGPIGDHLYGFKGYAIRNRTYNATWYALDNPVFQSEFFTSKSSNKNTTLLTTLFSEVELFKGLKFKTVFGYNVLNNITTGGTAIRLPAELDPNQQTNFDEGWSNGLQWNWINTFDYTKSFGRHNLGILVGTDALKRTNRAIYGRGVNLAEGQASISATEPTGRFTNGSPAVPSSLFSLLGRLNYNYDDKYLLSLVLRRDGSSKFSADSRFGYFPSISGAWRISNESFLNKSEVVDDLKIRASYGIVGNQNIADLQYLSSFYNPNSVFGYSFGENPTLSPGLIPQVLGNSNLKWEKNTESNIGLDASLLKGAFTVTVDLYKKRLSDLLGNVDIPFYSAPYNGKYLENAFTMENSGIELSLGFNKRIGNVNLSAGGFIATLKNKVIDLFPGNTSSFLVQPISIIGGTFNDQNAQTRTYVGKRVGSFWGYIFDGIIQNQAELDASGMAAYGAKVGDKRFKDISGPEGKPDGVVTNLDKTYLGNGLPGYTYGFNFKAEFKGIDLSAFFNGQGNVQAANMTNALIYHMRFHNSTGIVNGHKDLLNSWNGEGTSNTLPRNSYDAPTSNRFFSSDYIQNAAFLRLRNVALGYTLPAAIAGKVYMKNARIYVSAQNVLTITKYTGYDPEVGSAQIGIRALTSGVDFGRYPAARMFTLGINTQF
ncbi:SusC/RagA family TonB-linked outer membrane protein, partial [Dyadobacter sp. CY347]|uniref:SusC/RagA family TonB-linked outer membrane protein n=1 Tax=Dyadobacter sp. CY347 TaxID=2909336 RepID=UPI001F293477